MKLRLSKKRNHAWTMTDMVVAIAIVVVLATMLLTVLTATHRRSSRIVCLSNIHRVAFAFRIWAGDHNNQFPMFYSEPTNAAKYFQVMSNELVTPKVLICPFDSGHTPAANFQNDFNDSHVSYFVCPDANEMYPQQIVSGDANLAIDGVPVKSGLIVFPPNANISWTTARHGSIGSLAYADGSVAENSIAGLQSALALATNGTPYLTSRLAIP